MKNQQDSPVQGGADDPARRLYACEMEIHRLRRELELIKNSKVWRLAEFLRRLVYVRMLGWIPGFRERLVPAWGKWFRDHVSRNRYLVSCGLLKDDYALWRKQNEPDAAGIVRLGALAAELSQRPLLSVVMPVYNVEPRWLDAAISSVQAQVYDRWELCIVDDCSSDGRLRELIRARQEHDQRICSVFLEKNGGIAAASAAGLRLAGGDFVGMLDHDDLLAQDALYQVAVALNADPALDLVYSDEDKISESGQRSNPFFKPDWSPDTLRSYNYLCHFTVIRRSLLEEVGGFRPGFDGSQDYDLFLRVTERTEKIHHIPKILYHWRSIAGSTGQDGRAKMYAYDAAKKALAEHLDRSGRPGTVEDGFFLGSYRIRSATVRKPSVAVIVPSRDRVDLLGRCISSLLSKTVYGGDLSVLIVDNGSVQDATRAYYDSLRRESRVRLLSFDAPFNFSAINNFAVAQTDQELLLFLNNDTEIIEPGWLTAMVEHGQGPEVGAVGALLLYPDDTVQHGGVIVGIGGVAGHAHKYSHASELGYFGRLKIVQNLSAVTAACLLTRRHVFDAVGGFDEELSHAFNDLDFCLKIREKGWHIVYSPYARLSHHESKSRGYEDTQEKQRRFKKEREIVEWRWRGILAAGDPFYSPNLTLEHENFALKIL